MITERLKIAGYEIVHWPEDRHFAYADNLDVVLPIAEPDNYAYTHGGRIYCAIVDELRARTAQHTMVETMNAKFLMKLFLRRTVGRVLARVLGPTLARMAKRHDFVMLTGSGEACPPWTPAWLASLL